MVLFSLEFHFSSPRRQRQKDTHTHTKTTVQIDSRASRQQEKQERRLARVTQLTVPCLLRYVPASLFFRLTARKGGPIRLLVCFARRRYFFNLAFLSLSLSRPGIPLFLSTMGPPTSFFKKKHWGCPLPFSKRNFVFCAPLHRLALQLSRNPVSGVLFFFCLRVFPYSDGENTGKGSSSFFSSFELAAWQAKK